MSDISPITLDDLAPVEVSVEIVTSYGRKLVIPFHTLTWEEWEAHAKAVTFPTVPSTALAEDGKTKLPNPDDPLYKEQLIRAYENVMARRLFDSLERAGNRFPGETALDKLDTLRAKGDRVLVDKLIDKIVGASWRGEAELLNRADTFQADADGEGDPADLPAARVDGETVAVPAE